MFETEVIIKLLVTAVFGFAKKNKICFRLISVTTDFH